MHDPTSVTLDRDTAALSDAIYAETGVEIEPDALSDAGGGER